MSHRKDDLIETFFGSPFNGQLQQRNQTLTAFQRKALGADEFLANEFFEGNRVGQAGQDADLLVSAQLGAAFRTLHAFLQPSPHSEIVNVHELHSDRPAVSGAQAAKDFAQGERSVAMEGL